MKPNPTQQEEMARRFVINLEIHNPTVLLSGSDGTSNDNLISRIANLISQAQQQAREEERERFAEMIKKMCTPLHDSDLRETLQLRGIEKMFLQALNNK